MAAEKPRTKALKLTDTAITDLGSGPPDAVRDVLHRSDLAAPTTGFSALSGGRTNRIWRFQHCGEDIVCKLFANRGTALFPNDPAAEATALTHLSGTGIAPDFVRSLPTPVGTVLLYRHVPGTVWSGDCTDVATLIARLHRVAPPTSLRRIDSGGAAILATGDAMIAGQDDADARELRCLRPLPPELPPVQPVFLHADIVPQNIIDGPSGLCLIDWQCPAIGDPTEDLAIFLSPAMQSIYGAQPLSPLQESGFLDAYDHSDRTRRYAALAPVYYWRMAAYCLWKMKRGDRDYAAGFRAEISRLKAFAQPDTGEH